jgi:hypothetical protein
MYNKIRAWAKSCKGDAKQIRSYQVATQSVTARAALRGPVTVHVPLRKKVGRQTTRAVEYFDIVESLKRDLTVPLTISQRNNLNAKTRRPRCPPPRVVTFYPQDKSLTDGVDMLLLPRDLGPNESRSEINQGTWFRDTHEQFCNSDPLTSPCAISIFIDGAIGDTKGR